MSSSDTFGIPYRYQKIIAAVVPILGVAAAAALVVPRYQELQADRAELERVRASIAAQQEAIDNWNERDIGTFVARVPASRDEPVQFLRNLNAVAAQFGVRLRSFTASAPEQAAAAQAEANSPLVAQKTDAQKPAATPGALPPGTVPATLEITAEGNYPSMAMFFARLETYPRLISVTGVNMSSTKYPELTTKFHLTRYTGPDLPARRKSPAAGAVPSDTATAGAAPGASATARDLAANRATVTQAARPEAGRTE
ncbi:MAG TPA: hypothetical protein VM490_20830 [Armatimonadaceae bacterium]|nr:hypothetical protein [Armatimonadaceae bacterium]